MHSKRDFVKTITATEMRAINRSAILELIRVSGPISRPQIAETLQVSLPTVMRIVEELLVESLVRPTGHKEWSGGRKRSLLEFNGTDHIIIGIDLGGTKIYGAIANLNGDILEETNYTHKQTRADESYEFMCDVIDNLLEIARKIGKPMRGIGIGVPGVLDLGSGNVKIAPSLSWDNFPLRERLSKRYPFPNVLDNDVNLAALGELWFGSEGEVKDLVLIAIGTGIGAGIVINGMVYSGAHHMAGEIGYFIPDRTYLGCSFPGFGALEQLASGTGIAERARQALSGNWPPEQLSNLTSEDVFNSARKKQPWAMNILSDTVDYLAQAIAAIALIYDPDLIIIGGGVARSADMLIEPILSRLKNTIPILPKLTASQLGYRAAVYGAIVQLLRITSNYYTIEKFS